MRLKTGITHWTQKVPNHQWLSEDSTMANLGAAVPNVIVDSRPLSEVHRLDLSLFVVFEEAALRVSGALTRSAPTDHALNFSAQQTLDEARHREIFLNRLTASSQALGLESSAYIDAIKTPPLLKFLEHCYEVIDRGHFIEGLTLMNLVFEGMAYPLYNYEQRYWLPVDPYLTLLIKSAFVDETRHVAFGAQLIKELLKDDVMRKAKVVRLCSEATLLMEEVFEYYVRKFVRLFDSVAKIHSDLFANAEFAPGRKISETPYAEQVHAIQHSIKREHSLLLRRAGLV